MLLKQMTKVIKSFLLCDVRTFESRIKRTLFMGHVSCSRGPDPQQLHCLSLRYNNNLGMLTVKHYFFKVSVQRGTLDKAVFKEMAIV